MSCTVWPGFVVSLQAKPCEQNPASKTLPAKPRKQSSACKRKPASKTLPASKPCKQNPASKTLQAKPCQQNPASKTLQAKPDKNSPNLASKTLQAKPCEQNSKTLQAKPCKQNPTISKKSWNLKGKLSSIIPRVVVMERRAQNGLSKGTPQDGVFVLDSCL